MFKVYTNLYSRYVCIHTCRVYTKDCVDPTHIGRDISSCCYLRMLSYHHHHHWYLWIYPFFVSFSWHQIDSYLEHSNGDTFACAFDALHEPFRNIWLVPLCSVHATKNKRGEKYSLTAGILYVCSRANYYLELYPNSEHMFTQTINLSAKPANHPQWLVEWHLVYNYNILNNTYLLIHTPYSRFNTFN